jgi:hypothetical protein
MDVRELFSASEINISIGYTRLLLAYIFAHAVS